MKRVEYYEVSATANIVTADGVKHTREEKFSVVGSNWKKVQEKARREVTRKMESLYGCGTVRSVCVRGQWAGWVY